MSVPESPRASSPDPTPDREGNNHANGRRRRAADQTTSTNGDNHQPDEAEGRQIFFEPASEITPGKMEWLWEGRLRFGTVAIVQGDTGVGKSTLLRSLTADVTGGTPMIVKRRRRKPLGNVLWFSGEESLGATLRPRLEAAGADLKRVWCADLWHGGGSSRLELPADRELLEELIVDRGAVLTVIDPVFNFTDGNCDLDGPSMPARRFMAALAGVAERTNSLIVLTRNLTKNRGRGALASGRGSAELGNAARSVLHLERYPGRPHLFALAVAKVNDAPTPPALMYTLDAVWMGHRLTLRGKADLSADELAGGEDEALERSQLERAVGLLRHVLKDGEVESKVVKQKASDEIISERTLQKAAKLLGVRTRREGNRRDARSLWRLPTDK